MSASQLLAPSVLESAMRRALELAHRGPADDVNPQVGCVILGPGAEVVSEGWHQGSGTAHAEVMALSLLPDEWYARADELTAVVSLEPCNHTGRTGPCAVALIDAGIGQVAYGLSDPGDASSGGSATLRDAGVTVTGGLLEDDVRDMLELWLGRRVIPVDRPRITVKWAQTLDGRAAAADGTSQWITGADARADVHRKRAVADAILVGTGTLYADNPALTARSSDPESPRGWLLVPATEQPVPVVVGHRPIPEGSRVLDHPALGDERGFHEPIQLAGDDLEADMRSLRETGIQSVFVEGGPKIVSSLIASGLVDEVLIYVAPALLGGPKLALGDIGITNINDIARLRFVAVEQLGDDLLITARIDRTDTPTAPEEAI